MDQPTGGKSDKAGDSARSRDEIFLVAGSLILVMGGFVAAMPGGFWQIFLISFAFNLVGFLFSRGWRRKLLAAALTGLSGWLYVQDFLIWLA